MNSNGTKQSQTVPAPASGSSRRQFLGRLAAISAGLTVAAPVARAAKTTEEVQEKVKKSGPNVEITLKINGRTEKLNIDPRVTLLDAVRDKLHLTGTKKGCDRGACGACTLHLDGKRVVSCLTLAVTAAGQEVTTIEGLAQGEELHPVQTAFVKCDGFQCGFCTPGQIMSAAACIQEGHTKSDAEIREFMSGNLCRCGAYPNIVEAVKTAAQQMGRGTI